MIKLYCIILAFALMAAVAPAQGGNVKPAGPAEPAKLIVGVKEAAPFMIRRADGAWSGISYDLWDEIAQKLGVQCEYKVFADGDLKGLLDAVRSGQVQVALGALSVTSGRESQMDFTNSYYSTGLGIATMQVPDLQIGSILALLFSPLVLKPLGLVIFLFFVVGTLIWLIEHRHNPQHLHHKPLEGIFGGTWWSAVIMFGHDDMVPKTIPGKLLAILWMLVSIVLVSLFTAALASNLTIEGMARKVRSPEGLASPSVRVGTIESTSALDYLNRKKVRYQTFRTLELAINALAAGKIDAIVYDWPILKYVEKNNRGIQGFVVLPQRFNEQNYAIALPKESPLRKPINKALMECIESPEWEDLLHGYLGDQSF